MLDVDGEERKRTGVLAANALTFQRVTNEDERSEFVNVRPCATDLFQFNYVNLRRASREDSTTG